MSQTGLAEPPNEEPDAVERNLRSWSWATGGWAGFHAGLAILAVLMGERLNLETPTLRVLGAVTIGAWATAAIASWAFRRSFRSQSGFVAAGASLVAGITLPFVGEAAGGALLDGVLHLVAGVGFATALWRARSWLEAVPVLPVLANARKAPGGPTKE